MCAWCPILKGKKGYYEIGGRSSVLPYCFNMARENETAPAVFREEAVVFGPKESHCIKTAVPYFENVESHNLRMLVQGTRKYFAFLGLSPTVYVLGVLA